MMSSLTFCAAHGVARAVIAALREELYELVGDARPSEQRLPGNLLQPFTLCHIFYSGCGTARITLMAHCAILDDSVEHPRVELGSGPFRHAGLRTVETIHAPEPPLTLVRRTPYRLRGTTTVRESPLSGGISRAAKPGSLYWVTGVEPASPRIRRCHRHTHGAWCLAAIKRHPDANPWSIQKLTPLLGLPFQTGVVPVHQRWQHRWRVGNSKSLGA